MEEFDDLTNSSRNILGTVKNRFPEGTERVPADFVYDLLKWYQALDKERPSPQSALRLRRLHSLYSKAKTKEGLRADRLYSGLLSLMERRPIIHAPDSSIIQLERQLRELRALVTSPSEIEHKVRDLQEQLEAIRADVDGGRSAISDKQEDMLQKFLSAPKKAFIIMPFQREFDNVWFGGIKPACLESHYAPLRVDEVNLSSLITEDIVTYTGMADVVMVDLTGNNPNVMFELGWSLAKDKKPIVICQGEHSSKVAFDVRGIRHITYENSWLGVEALKKKMKEFIVTTEKQPSAKKDKKGKVAKASGKPQKTA